MIITIIAITLEKKLINNIFFTLRRQICSFMLAYSLFTVLNFLKF